jgi:hypothetical protein
VTTNFPSSIDAFTNPTSADTLDNPPHDQQHADINDAMEAVQTSLLDGAPLFIDDANERVGIGTTEPGQALDVRGRIVANYTDNAFPLSVQSGQSTSGIILADADTTSNVVLRSKGDDFQIRTNASDRVTVDSSGNVGIGTTTPRTPLEIQGTSSGSVDEVLLLAADGNQVAGSGARLHLSGGNATQRSAYVEGVNTSGTTNAHALTFGTSAGGSDPVERMRITASGNVGINDTSPSYTLDVDGDINTTGSVLVNGSNIGDWNTFTPSFSFFTTGNAIRNGFYRRIGNHVDYWGYMELGTTTVVSNGFSWVPLYNVDTTIQLSMNVVARQAATSNEWRGIFSTTSTNRLRPIFWTSINAASTASASSPMSWTTGDNITFWGSQKVA